MPVQIRNNPLEVILMQDLRKGKILAYKLICLFKRGNSYTYLNKIKNTFNRAIKHRHKPICWNCLPWVWELPGWKVPWVCLHSQSHLQLPVVDWHCLTSGSSCLPRAGNLSHKQKYLCPTNSFVLPVCLLFPPSQMLTIQRIYHDIPILSGTKEEN